MRTCDSASVFTPVEPIVSGPVIVVQQFPAAALSARERRRSQNTVNHQTANNEESRELTGSSLLETSKPNTFSCSLSCLTFPSCGSPYMHALTYTHARTSTHTHTHCLSRKLVLQTHLVCKQTADVMGTNTQTRAHTLSCLCPEVTGLECN